ncbi:hypothetical protein TIFTF001_003298 [Ficus carica]|uniref:Uncharacterized protein n=1 Tax=Ficus carica TaxID=3494 RepID=A0AA87ZEF6_FICCA|nr:hypothetical protein TIFTF001_003298 [Ficus carica]
MRTKDLRSSWFFLMSYARFTATSSYPVKFSRIEEDLINDQEGRCDFDGARSFDDESFTLLIFECRKHAPSTRDVGRALSPLTPLVLQQKSDHFQADFNVHVRALQIKPPIL